MASNIMGKNGHRSTPPKMSVLDVKIVVVGEIGCGKSKFIEAFYDRNCSPEIPGPYADMAAKIYSCRYEIDGEITNVKIYEILGGPDEIVEHLVEQHTDSNGYIFVYAIDDPSSFEKVKDKWYPALNNDATWGFEEPGIVVGTKRDLRENQQVINRLALANQIPVTVEQGKGLEELNKINKYFDCSSTEPHNIDEAFDYILRLARYETGTL